MDFVTPGLWRKAAISGELIAEINNNNRNSLEITKKFKEVNKLTGKFLSKQLATYDATGDSNFAATQDVFQQVYYLLNIQDFKLNQVSKVDLTKLQSIYSKTTQLDTANASEVASTTTKLTNYYLTLTLNLHLSNSLIYQTLVLKSNLVYWENLNSSRKSKIIYLIQTLPSKIWNFGKSIYEDSKSSLENQYEITTNGTGTEEDHRLYHNWVLFKRYVLVFYRTGHKIISSAFIQNNPAVALLKISKTNSWKNNQFIKFVLNSPFTLVNHEIKDKITFINDQITANTDKIDLLLKSNVKGQSDSLDVLEEILEITPTSTADNNRINSILSSVIAFQQRSLSFSAKPSFVVRYWPALYILIRFGPSQSQTIYHNREAIVDWFKHNFIDTVYGFYKNWLVKPVTDMLNILRHDDELSITLKESLQSDLNSLERMVIEFLTDENVTDVDKSQIHQMIQNGDLTLLMSKYENQIRSPVKSIIKGSLIRSLLIQIQKTKVDGGIAINGIDKLLKSQQLVFGIVSISPSLLIVYKLWTYLTSAKPIVVNGKQVNVICLKSLNNIENLLVLLANQGNGNENYEGQLLIEIINLIVSSKPIIPKQLRNDWIRDLNELNNSDFNIDTKLNLVRKIWNMYAPYFR